MHFSLPASGYARLDVFDVSGARVRTLVDGLRPAGEQSVSWDARDVRGRAAAPGVYYVRLEAAGHRLLQRVVIAR